MQVELYEWWVLTGFVSSSRGLEESLDVLDERFPVEYGHAVRKGESMQLAACCMGRLLLRNLHIRNLILLKTSCFTFVAVQQNGPQVISFPNTAELWRYDLENVKISLIFSGRCYEIQWWAAIVLFVRYSFTTFITFLYDKTVYFDENIYCRTIFLFTYERWSISMTSLSFY